MQDAKLPYNPYDYTPSQLWCLGLSAINTEYNEERHDLLKHSDPDKFMQTLRGWWDIHNQKTYEESVSWLRKEGHRVMFGDHWGAALIVGEQEWEANKEALRKADPKSFNRQTLVRHYRNMLGSQGIVAWDLGRVILLARMAATCGYIPEADAWKTIMEEGQQAVRLFKNWYQYAHSYLIGRQYAMGNLDDANGLAYIRTTHYLLTDPSSPWQRYPQFNELQPVAEPTAAH